MATKDSAFCVEFVSPDEHRASGESQFCNYPHSKWRDDSPLLSGKCLQVPLFWLQEELDNLLTWHTLMKANTVWDKSLHLEGSGVKVQVTDT